MSFDEQYKEIGLYLAEEFLSGLDCAAVFTEDPEKLLENRVILQLNQDVERFITVMAELYKEARK